MTGCRIIWSPCRCWTAHTEHSADRLPTQNQTRVDSLQKANDSATVKKSSRAQWPFEVVLASLPTLENKLTSIHYADDGASFSLNDVIYMTHEQCLTSILCNILCNLLKIKPLKQCAGFLDSW